MNVASRVVKRNNLRLHAALQTAGHGLPVTYPHIFVNGSFLGGCEELKASLKTGELLSRLQHERTPWGDSSYPAPTSVFAPPPESAALWGVVLQMRVYANVIRFYSLLHVVIFAALLASDAAPDGNKAASAVLVFLLVDLALMVLAGPVPIAPLGLLASCAVARCKGAAVTAIPYKVIFSFYFIIVMLVLGFHRGATGTYSTIVLNSSLLAVLRF